MSDKISRIYQEDIKKIYHKSTNPSSDQERDVRTMGKVIPKKVVVNYVHHLESDVLYVRAETILLSFVHRKVTKKFK